MRSHLGLALIAIATTTMARATGPTFEVASVKRCTDTIVENRGGGGSASPGLLTLNCQILSGVIQMAYLTDGTGPPDPGRLYTTPFEGMPAWANAERYTIAARAAEATPLPIMRGPMMRALLEERFQLRIHTASRNVPVYALTVAKGGARLAPFTEGTCAEPVLTLPTPPPPAGQRYCSRAFVPTGGTRAYVAEGMTIADFVRVVLSGGPLAGIDRRVIDRTGLTGKYNFRIEWASTGGPALVPGAAPPPADSTGPPIFTALQEQLGLKLEATIGPGEYFVIEHLERPSDN